MNAVLALKSRVTSHQVLGDAELDVEQGSCYKKDGIVAGRR